MDNEGSPVDEEANQIMMEFSPDDLPDYDVFRELNFVAL